MNESRYFSVPGSDRRYDRNKLLAVLLIPLAMSLLQVSSVDNLLPAMQAGLDASSSDVQWVLSGYALAVGIVLVPSGRLGDVFGRSGMFVIGLVIFVLGSFACGLMNDAAPLNAMRIIQGIGAGVFSPQVTGLIQQYFDGRARARAFGFMGLVISVSVATGPILSGLFVAWLGDDSGWRWSFLINAPIGLIGLFFAFTLLPFGKERRTIGPDADANEREYVAQESAAGRPAPRKYGSKLDLDPVGMILLCLAVLGIMLPFMASASWRWFMLIGGVVIGVTWVCWEVSYKRRGHIPMVDLDLFKLNTFSSSVGITALQFLGTTSVFVILAMFLQNGMGASALVVGLVGLPSAVASAFAAVWSGKHALEKGWQLQVLAMSLATVAALIAIAVAWYISEGGAVWWLSLPLILLGCGLGCMGAANQTTAMLDVPASHGGTAGGVYQTTQRIATAIGNALVTAVFFAVSSGARTGTSAGNTQWFHAFGLGMTVIAVVAGCSLVATIVALAKHRRAETAEVLVSAEVGA